jgi:hypothetical protein
MFIYDIQICLFFIDHYVYIFLEIFCMLLEHMFMFVLGLSALLVPQVLPKSNFGPSTFFSLKLAPKHLIRSTYHPRQRF